MKPKRKQCPKHGWLPTSEFYRDKHKPDGLTTRCKRCFSEYESDPGVAPGIKQYKKRYKAEYSQRPAVKAKAAAYQKSRREAINERRRRMPADHRKRTTDKQYFYTIFRRFGVTRDDYENLLLAQNERCATCNQPFDARPNVDHDHKTGRVRGLLCRRCNYGLGNFNDDVDNLVAAVRYLGGA